MCFFKYGARWALFVLVLSLFSGCQDLGVKKEDCSSMNIVALFPKSVDDVQRGVSLAIDCAQEGLKAILSIASSDRSFANTAKAYDEAGYRFGVVCSTLSVTKMVHPDAAIRDACHEGLIRLNAFAVDNFLTVDMYRAFKVYRDTKAASESLDDEERYYLKEALEDFERAGLHLPEDKIPVVKGLQKELSTLALSFSKNVAEDKSSIHVSEEDLAGMSPDFIKSLERDKDGKCIVYCDYPSRDEVLKHCSVASTRRAYWKAYGNRAYPANKPILSDIITKRDEFARTLRFESFAAFDTNNQMAKTPANVRRFLDDLAGKVDSKEAEEFALLSSDLPEGVVLRDGKFELWDLGYVKECYRKKHFEVDDREVAQYFPVEKTIQGIFDIYQKFLNLDFKLTKPAGLWHEDVSVIEIRKRGGTGVSDLLGNIIIDLYPRPNKYKHACNSGILSSVKGGCPSLSIVIANFPKSTADKPSLLKHSDATTLFHEFGHAMHHLLGRTKMYEFAGAQTKHDFIEVPSQMFEEWLWDKDILKMVTSHFKTGESIPDTLVDKMLELKRFGSGYFVQRQCCLARMSLDYYQPGQNKDLDTIERSLFNNMMNHVCYDGETHVYASFGHLVNGLYSSKYYNYLWSKVYALDLFEKIREEGLLNCSVGDRLTNLVLGLGGSVDPNKLLKDFLGREPNQDAFLRDIGLNLKTTKGTNMPEKTEILSFFGPPGTGKGTVAARCVSDLGYVMLSTGDLARRHIQEQSDLGKTLQTYVNKGQLIPDDLITEMVLEWLRPQIVSGRMIILDGFPRTKGQADCLLNALKSEETFSSTAFKVINFDLSSEEIIARISNRLVCSNKKCQRVYSLTVKQPEKPGLCDVCGSDLMRRPDDEESVVRERLHVFDTFKTDLLGFYKDSSQNVIHFVIPVGGPNEVFDAFVKLLSA